MSNNRKKLKPSSATRVTEEAQNVRDHTKAVNAAARPFRTRMKNQSLNLAWRGLAALIDMFIVMSIMLIFMPLTALFVAQSNQITTRSNGVNIIGLWLVPMIFFSVFMAAVTFVVTRKIWVWGARHGRYARDNA